VTKDPRDKREKVKLGPKGERDRGGLLTRKKDGM